MTPSEAKKLEPKTGSTCVLGRKPSFSKQARKQSNVQTLTRKFNQLSDASQNAKPNFKSKKPKSNKVVVTRKPSITKYRRTEPQKARVKPAPPKKPDPDKTSYLLNVKNITETQKNVLRKVTEYEKIDASISIIKEIRDKKRTMKIPDVPKVIVDIDIKDVPNVDTEPVYQKNCLTVKSAITIFEQSLQLEHFKEKEKLIKDKPIAAIKPILKKPERVEENCKVKLTPKDSLYRVRYVAMKKDLLGNETNKCKEKSVEQVTEKREKTNENEEPRLIEAKEVKVQSECGEKMLNYSSLFQQISSSHVLKEKTAGRQRQFARLLKEVEKLEKNDTGKENVMSKNEETGKENLIMKKEDKTSSLVKLLRGQSHTKEKDAPRPNLSFLWSKKEDTSINTMGAQKKDTIVPPTQLPLKDTPVPLTIPLIKEVTLVVEPHKSNRVDMPLPLPPDNVVDVALPLPPDTVPDLYPDNLSDNTVYDDIAESNEGYERVENEKNSLYCISEALFSEEYNIYEDIQSVRNKLVLEEESNCYESIYNGYAKSSVSDTSSRSNSSSKSAYEKNNSLYGVAAVNSDVSPQTLSSSCSDGTGSDVVGYQETPLGLRPNSEASQSNSDEWVEMSDSDAESDVSEVPERTRRNRTSAWPHKVRRRWSKLQQQRNMNRTSLEETKTGGSDDHLYETISQYQKTETLFEDEGETEPLYSEDQFVDDFDSDTSGEFEHAQLPETPNNGYNITKSLKAAGRKLRKNFSMRKNDLSKSLKRFRKVSRPKVEDNTFLDVVDADHGATPSADVSPSLSDPNVSQNFHSDSSSSSHNQSNPKHRKTWTFRSKFRKQSSSPSLAISPAEEDSKSSVFYLALSEVTSAPNPGTTTSPRSSVEVKRLSVGSTRPSVPPPPPPVDSEKNLYAECGLFDKQAMRRKSRGDSTTSWYTEVGLYNSDASQDKRKSNQIFKDEPLYQFYTECVNQQARDDILNNYDSEGYEELNGFYTIINDKRCTLDIKNVNPNLEDFDESFEETPTSPFRSQTRTLWCQIPSVVDSCVLATLTDQQKKLQEAKFEIITSEGSYMNSLNVLENHFMRKLSQFPEAFITKRDFKILFGNILSVKEISESFLSELESCWKDNIMLTGVCDVVLKHARENFHVYIKYCKNQICINRTLRELTDKNSGFEAAMKDVEKDPACQSLTIHSFLMLPMQRVTRLPLLLGAVLARLDKDDAEWTPCRNAFDLINKIVQECDDEARKMEKCEEMLILSQQLEFPKELKAIPLITGSRFLVKRGPVTQLVGREENKLTFGKKLGKVSLTLLLFTDLLVVGKKKGARNYTVVDHCPRNLVELSPADDTAQLPVRLMSTESCGKHLMLLTMLENHGKKTVEMLLSFHTESDRQRWLEAFSPRPSDNPGESIYEEWDCPQVIAIYEFAATQPDELSLCIGDVVNVLKKMKDGWYQGERLRDGCRGWFPQNHTQEISSSHVRAKNKKQRYQLLALSGNIVESQIRKPAK